MTQENGSAPVEMSVLRRQFENDKAIMQRFGFKFIEVARQGLCEMKLAQNKRDLPELARLGHKLKSSARTIGALSFSDLCEALETANANGDWAAAGAVIARLPLLLDQITNQLNREFE